MKPVLHHIRCLIIVPALLLGSAVAAERTFKWVDENGQVHYGDRVPPRYVDKERREMNEQGRTVRIYEAPKTPEQKAREQRLAVVAAAKKKLAEKQHRRDRMLLATYSSEEDMLLARDGKVESVETLIQLTRRRIASMERRLRELTDEAAEYERSGKKLPVGLEDQLASIRKQISENEAFVKQKEQEKEAIARQFDADIARFRELTSQGSVTARSGPEEDIDAILDELEEEQPAPSPAVATAQKTPRRKIPESELTRHDRTLLASYASEADLFDTRAEKLAPVEQALQEASATLDELQSRLEVMLDNADEYERRGETLPEILVNGMQEVLDEIARNESILQAKRREKREIVHNFNADLDRYRQLTVQ